MTSLVNYIKQLKNKQYQPFRKTEEEEYFPTHPVKPVLPLYRSQRKTLQEKKTTDTPYLNIDLPILNKIIVNWILQHMEWIITHDLVGFIPRIQSWFNIWKSLINIIHLINKGQNPHDQQTYKNIFTKSNTIHNKNSQQIKKRRKVLQPD